MNAPVTFDTLAFMKRLEAAGMDTKQAEAFAQALNDVAFESVTTKSDLRDLEHRLVVKLGGAIAAATALTVAILGLLNN